MRRGRRVMRMMRMMRAEKRMNRSCGSPELAFIEYEAE